MTLSNTSNQDLTTKTDINDGSTNLDSLYCSHLWSNSNLRRAILNAPCAENKIIKYCYTCKGKVRKYEIKLPSDNFVPNHHSTPNEKIIKHIEYPLGELLENSVGDGPQLCRSSDKKIRNPEADLETVNADNTDCIPSISSQIDSSFRQKFTSYEMRPNEINQRRLRKSLRGIGCIVNFSLTDSPVKKRTQIQACSISVMIVAIVVISFVLVNFTTPNFTRATKVVSTIVVPTNKIKSNNNSFSTTIIYTDDTLLTDESTTVDPTTVEPFVHTTENITLMSSIISKIRKNIRTYPKVYKERNSYKVKDIINRDLSEKFCSCQTNEVCMLDENSGKSICKQSIDIDDPTGCGGLCALETEACQLVDKMRGVRVCRLLTLVTCSEQEWRCRNGLCVRAEARCDGSIQCYDRSDEMHCDCDLTKQFRCGHSISCFPNTKLCDGIIDCWDGFDEVNCTTECPKDQFTCTDGQCILSSRFCDGFADCEDGSDEPNGCDGGCSAHELRCVNHRCVPHAARCDGHDNCGDATDELHCS
ncbi:uncharacterized protein LOC113518541 [Galleria mellonella]|uniref:Uncharacterized protein LOC113518541 n=1 Tax=Galleria mellonella TaxID=7137 RepID=A0A6J1X140_GALME|nr:uncharacterized protein LOC113518541 [Galleria mellonella]XP_026759320.2 uncharacterized protein LOC113518541 [Galleria mellonella]XP_031769215.2 uncharacterized protein LOC113518541 [Galleria mellonella]